MKALFSIEAPDGQRHYLTEKGDEITRDEAIAEAKEFWDADEELERRVKRWSVKHDCLIREPRTEGIEL